MGAAASRSIASFAESVVRLGDDIIDEARVAIGSILAGGFSLIETMFGFAIGQLLNAVLRFFAEEIEDSYLSKLAHEHREKSTRSGDIVGGMASDLVKVITGPIFAPVSTIIIPALVNKATPEDMKDVLSLMKTVMDATNLDNIARFIRDLDGQKVLDWVLDIIKDSRSALRDVINQASEKGMGSIQIMADAEANYVIGATVIVGVSIDIDYLLYSMANGGDMTGWTGIRALSFHGGVTVSAGAAFGGDVSVGCGLHTSKPDGVDGFSFAGDVEAAFGAGIKGGIGLSVTFPPEINQFVVAVGGGEKVEISVGINATSIIGYFDPENGLTPATPSARHARESGNPSLFYSKYDWEKLEFDLNKMNFGAMVEDSDNKFPSYYWEKLGWNEESWNNLTDVPTTMTTPWDRLSVEHRRAATSLGFTPKTWNAPVCVDAWTYSKPDDYWEIFDWNEMLENEMNLWSGLGWDERSWQGNSSPPDTVSKNWDDLTYYEQCCAIELGYDKTRWEGWDVQMVAKTGDAFNYSPWGGKCLVKYTTEGCLWVYHESNNNNSGIRVWKCMSASDTQKLLAGYTVKVLWDNTYMFPMTATNENTFVVRHSDGRNYEFNRTTTFPTGEVVALKTAHNSYLYAAPGKYATVSTQTYVGPWERFTIEPVSAPGESGFYCIRTAHGTYLRSEPGQFAEVNTQTYVGGPYEWFKIEPISYEKGVYSIRTGHGTYLRAEPGQSANVNTQTTVGTFEKFRINTVIEVGSSTEPSKSVV